MHKVTIALATFAVFLGCEVGSPTSPSAAKSTKAAAEQCPMPILGIVGTWAGQGSTILENINTADTLWIEFAPDPNPAGEPGVTYYDYTLLSYYSPSDGDDLILAELADMLGLTDLGLPSLLEERRGKMGVYYADGGKWAFNHTVTYIRSWNLEEYEEWGGRSEPSWGHEIKMFDGWLVLQRTWYDIWDEDYEYEYERVDE